VFSVFQFHQVTRCVRKAVPGKHVFVLSGFKSHLINEIRWGTLSPP
jgi:hypothetical protein